MKSIKKIVNLFCLFLLFFGVTFLLSPKVSAATLTSDTYVCSDGTSASYCNSGTIWHDYGDGEPLLSSVLYVDGQLAYCLEPGVSVNHGSNAYSPNNWNSSGLSLTNDKINQIELIAYFGYGYSGHDSYLWYLAAQKLIWKVVNPSINVTLTLRKNGPTFSVSTYENQITELVNNFKTAPSFAGQTIKGKLSEGVTLTDTNNVLSNWNVSSDDDCNVEVSGNQVTITSDKEQDITLNMSRKGLSSNTSIIYRSQGYQTVGVLKLNTPIIRSTSVKLVNVEYPTITKEVSKDKVELGEEFTYTFQYTVDKLEEGIYYNSFLIEDTFEPVLKLTDVNQVKIYNENEEDVTDLYDISIVDNKLQITVKDLKNDDFYGHTYNVVVTTEILSNADLSSYDNNGLVIVPNEVTLTVDDHVSKDSVPVTYEVVVIEVPETAARVSLIIVGVGIACIVAGIGGYYIIVKKNEKKRKI